MQQNMLKTIQEDHNLWCPKTIVKKERKKKITNITENKAKDKNMKNHKKRKK